MEFKKVEEQGVPWKERFRLVEYAYGLNVVNMLTIQEVVKREFKKLEEDEKTKVLALVKDFHLKKTKDNAASVIEEICQILNPANSDPRQKIALLNDVLNDCCFRYAFYGEFGLNHIFAVIFSPLLAYTYVGNWQEKYFVRIKKSLIRVPLSEVLNLHNKILSWHQTCGQCGKAKPIFGLDAEFLRKATIESREFELDSDENGKFYGCHAMSDTLEMYYAEKNLGFNNGKVEKL